MGPDQMETTPPFPIVSSQRQLSVIMFTDAVSYSARMNVHEVATLHRLERDTEAMRRVIGSHAGTVLKSTGDGLLIQFVSAVQAVACAQEIQRHFASLTDPAFAQSALRYRIGVHLGDVFVGNGDVMGDGVNIAARLVGQAPPGGIVISHMVYDVLKNKLPLHVQRMGPQQLKNIGESLVLYRVLLDEPQAAVPVTPASVPAVPVDAGVAPRRTRRLLAALGLGLGLAVTAKFLVREYSAYQEGLSRSQTAQAALDELLKKSTATTDDGPAELPAGSNDHNFAALVTRTPAGLDTRPEGSALRLAAEQSTVPLFRWLAINLEGHTKERPLSVGSLGNPSFPGATLFLDEDRRLNFIEGGAFRRREWSDLKPDVQAAIMVSVMRASMAPIPPEVRQGAAAFAYLHGLPEMIAALPR